MPIDPEEELRCLWLQWVKDAKSAYDIKTPQKFNRFYADQRNHRDDIDGNGRNSVMDAEALLILLQAQGSLDAFNLRKGTEALGEGVNVLNSLVRPATKPPARLDEDALPLVMEVISEYLEHNREGGEPTFGASTYLDPTDHPNTTVTDHDPDIVDSYTLSVSACLHILNLLGESGWGNKNNTGPIRSAKCKPLCDLASQRLTAALEGLCRSFAYKETTIEKWEEATRIVWPGPRIDPLPHTDSTIEDIRIRLDHLGYPTRQHVAFECGWSWGIHPDALAEPGAVKPSFSDAVSSSYPYLYFTVNAIDGIDDLFEDWVQTEEILNPQQLTLAARLRNLSDLTTRYWGAIAFSPSTAQRDRWALEAVPWRTADGSQSLQWTLYVYGLALRECLAGRRANTSPELTRLIDLLEELAERGRITRTPTDNVLPKKVSEKLREPDRDTGEPDVTIINKAKRDPALALHFPGVELTLEDKDDKPLYTLLIYDFAPQLLKRAAILLTDITNLDLRERLRGLIDAIWDDHLSLRSNTNQKGVSKYWDFPERAYSSIKKSPGTVILTDPSIDEQHPASDRVTSWYLTQRVCESLIATSHAIGSRQRTRLVTVESFLREFSDHIANDIDLQISRSGTSDRPRLEKMRQDANKMRKSIDQGQFTSCLQSLIELIRNLEEPQ